MFDSWTDQVVNLLRKGSMIKYNHIMRMDFVKQFK